MHARIPKRASAALELSDSDDEIEHAAGRKRGKRLALSKLNAFTASVSAQTQQAAANKTQRAQGGFYQRARLKAPAVVPIQPQITEESEQSAKDEASGEDRKLTRMNSSH